MTDINTTLTQTEATLAAMQQTAAVAAAGGAAQAQTAEAAWQAVADLEAAKAQADGLRGQLVARDAKLTQALTARAAALAKAELERTAGSKPLADTTAIGLGRRGRDRRGYHHGQADERRAPGGQEGR